MADYKLTIKEHAGPGRARYEAFVELKGVPYTMKESDNFEEVRTWYDAQRRCLMENHLQFDTTIMTKFVRFKAFPSRIEYKNFLGTSTYDGPFPINGFKLGRPYAVSITDTQWPFGIPIVIPGFEDKIFLFEQNENVEPAPGELGMTLGEIKALRPVLTEDATLEYVVSGDGDSFTKIGNIEFQPKENYVAVSEVTKIIHITPAVFKLPGYLQYFFIKWGYHRLRNDSDITAEFMVINDCARKLLPLNDILEFMKEYFSRVKAPLAAERIQQIELLVRSMGRTIRYPKVLLPPAGTYQVSKDYTWLYALICQGKEIACYVNYEAGGTNIDLTKCSRDKEFGIFVGGNGIEYFGVREHDKDKLPGLSEEEIFRNKCEEKKLEWIIPASELIEKAEKQEYTPISTKTVGALAFVKLYNGDYQLQGNGEQFIGRITISDKTLKVIRPYVFNIAEITMISEILNEKQ